MDKTIVFLLLILLCASLIDAQRRRNRGRGRGRGGKRDPCHLSRAEACMEKARELGKGPDPTSIIATAAGVERICKTIKEDMIKCVKGYVKKCGTNLHKEMTDLVIDQVLLNVKLFCDNQQAKADFLKQSPCMHEKVFRTDTYKSTCNNNFLATIDAIEAKTSASDDVHGSVCCGFNTWEDCTSQLIQKECGTDGHKSFKEFTGKYMGTLTTMFCPKDLFNIASQTCKKAKPAAGKATGKIGDNAITKYVTSLFSFLFVTN